jgi:hypothetical protein
MARAEEAGRSKKSLAKRRRSAGGPAPQKRLAALAVAAEDRASTAGTKPGRERAGAATAPPAELAAVGAARKAERVPEWEGGADFEDPAHTVADTPLLGASALGGRALTGAGAAAGRAGGERCLSLHQPQASLLAAGLKVPAPARTAVPRTQDNAA